MKIDTTTSVGQKEGVDTLKGCKSLRVPLRDTKRTTFSNDVEDDQELIRAIKFRSDSMNDIQYDRQNEDIFLSLEMQPLR